MHAALIFKNLNFSLIPSQKHLAWRVTSTSAEAMPSLSIKKKPKKPNLFCSCTRSQDEHIYSCIYPS